MRTLVTSSASNSNRSAKRKAQRALSVSSSIAAMAVATSPVAVYAQTSTDDETVTTEVVAVDGQELDDGRVLGGFLPVVIGGEGDLLFLSRTANDSFITFDGSLDAVVNARPFGFQNSLLGNYSIDSFGDQFAITTRDGIVTGSVSDNIGIEVSLDTAFLGIPARDQGNLDSASPLILNERIALSLSNVGLNEADGSFIGNTMDFALFSEAGSNIFQQVDGFTFDPLMQTSLNFAGASNLVASFSAVFSSPTDAQTSNLRRVNLAAGVDSAAIQIGPNGNPQPNPAGGFLGGDLTFGGFTFFDNTGGNFIGSGANFDSRQFSSNSSDTAFVLGNAGLALDGTAGDDVPGQLLVLNDQVILTARNSGGQTVQTSAGELDILRFENVIMANNGDILFSTGSFFRTGGDPARELANSVSLWRIINPGQANQEIVPVIREGDELILSASGLQALFPNSSPPSTAEIVGFDFSRIPLSQGITTNGRPQLFSVNQQGHVATVAQIDSDNGPVDALIAQDDNGAFHVVAFVGQPIDIDGQGTIRRITNFTAQFGSNDVDGAGDLFNLDEQLGFIVVLDDPNTAEQEFSRAVLRVSLNGVETVEIREFLWSGDCGDDEFSTTCQIAGENGSNWVNNEDAGQIAEAAPGIFDLGVDAAIIRGADVRISEVDIDLASIESDSRLTLQQGRTLVLRNGGTVDDLVLEKGNVTTNGALSVRRLQLDSGTVTGTAEIRVRDSLNLAGGTIASGTSLVANSEDQENEDINHRLTGNVQLDGTLNLALESETVANALNLTIGDSGRLLASGGADVVVQDSTIGGNGLFEVADNASLAFNGTNRVEARLLFSDALADRNPDEDGPAISVLGGTTTLANLTFQSSNLGARVLRPEFNGVDIQGVFLNQTATLNIDGQLTVSDYVIVDELDGALEPARLNIQNDSQVDISRNATLENRVGIITRNEMGDVTGFAGGLFIEGATVSGDGLLFNRNFLQVESSTIESLFLTSPVAPNGNLDPDNPSRTVFVGNNIIRTNGAAAQSGIDLLQEGLLTTDGGNRVGNMIDMIDGVEQPSVSAVLDDVIFRDGMTQITPGANGDDAAAFLSTITLQDAQVMAQTNLVIGSGTFTLSDQNSSLLLGGTLLGRRPVSILGSSQVEGSNDEFDINLVGSGTVMIDNADIAVVPTVTPFAFANTNRIENQLGGLNAEAAGNIEFGTDSFARTDSGLLSIEDSSLSSIELINRGVLRLDTVDLHLFADDSGMGGPGVGLFNGFGDQEGSTDGAWVSLEGEIGFSNNLLDTAREIIILNSAGSRVQIDGAADISGTIDNQGTLVAGANSGMSSVERVNITDGDRFVGQVAALTGSELTIGRSDALTEVMATNDPAANAGAMAESFALNGRFTANGGQIIINDEGGDAALISEIADRARITISDGGGINNLGETITGLTRVEGRFIAEDSLLQGGTIAIDDGVLRVADYDFSNVALNGGSFSVVSDAMRTFTDRTNDNNLTVSDTGIFSIDRGGLETGVDGFGLVLVEQDGLFTARGVDVQIDDLTLTGNALFRARDIMGDELELSNASNASIRSAEFERITVTSGSRVDLAGGVTAENLLVAGMIVAANPGADANAQQAVRNADIGTLTVQASGMAQFRFNRMDGDFSITNLTVDDGGVFSLVDDMASGAGTYDIDNLIANGMVDFDVQSNPTLERTLTSDSVTIGSSGVLDIGGANLQVESATVGNILRGNQTDFASRFTVQANAMVEMSALNGTAGANSRLINQGGTVILDGMGPVLSDLRVEGDGNFNIMGDANLTQLAISVNGDGISNWAQRGNLDAGSLVIAGEGEFVLNGALDVARDGIFNNRNVTVNGRTDVGRVLVASITGTGLFNNNVTVGNLARFGGQWSVFGSLTTGGRVTQDGPVNGIAGSTDILGDATIASSLDVRAGGSFTVGGDLTINGTLVPDDSADLALASVGGAPLATKRLAVATAQENNGDEEPASVASRVDGALIVGGDASVSGGLAIDNDATVQIGGDGSLEQVTVDGMLIVNGNLVADVLTVNGLAQFGSGQFTDLSVGNGARLFGGDFQTAGDFTNLGTFQLGNSDAGAGTFDFGGVFRQAGVFSGVGTINGDVIQEAIEGGLAANAILFNPGFSPGIVNINGDAVFNDGAVFFEIGGLTPGAEHDQINVSGDLTIGSNALIVVDLLELDDGSGIFLPRTGEEIVIFTASDITPDDVEKINFSVIDTLPLGFTLVPDITQTETGEIFRVLRGFDGSQLAALGGLDASQLAVAGALDFLSTAESGVPSPEIFQLAVDLQFSEDPGAQLDSLTALSATTLSAMQDSAMQAGSIGVDFAQRRLRAQAGGLIPPQKSAAAAPTGTNPAQASAAYNSGVLDRQATAAFVAKRASQGGGTEYFAGDGSIFRVIGGTSYLFGDSGSRGGTTGFDYEGWSATAAVEFESDDGDLLLGGALSLGNVEADLDDDRGEVETDSFAGTIYGQFNSGPVSIAVGYSVADLDIESQRQVLGANATGEVDGDLQHLFSRLSVQFVDTDDWKLGPEATLVHSDLEIDSLSETGAGALSLITRSLDRKATRLNLSGQLAREFDTGGVSGALLFGVGYQFALAGDEFITNSVSFAPALNTTFANPLRPLLNDGFDLNLGIDVLTASGVSVGLHYDGLWAESSQDVHDLSVAVSVSF